jgi:hypothetical protein
MKRVFVFLFLVIVSIIVSFATILISPEPLMRGFPIPFYFSISLAGQFFLLQFLLNTMVILVVLSILYLLSKQLSRKALVAIFLVCISITLVYFVASYLFTQTKPAEEPDTEILFFSPELYLVDHPSDTSSYREQNATFGFSFLLQEDLEGRHMRGKAINWNVGKEKGGNEESWPPVTSLRIGLFAEEFVNTDALESSSGGYGDFSFVYIGDDDRPVIAAKKIESEQYGNFYLAVSYRFQYGPEHKQYSSYLSSAGDTLKNIIDRLRYSETIGFLLTGESTDWDEVKKNTVYEHEEYQKSFILGLLYSGGAFDFFEKTDLYIKGGIRLGGDPKILDRNSNYLGFCDKYLSDFEKSNLHINTEFLDCRESKRNVSVSIEMQPGIHYCLDTLGYKGVIRGETIEGPTCSVE